MGLKPHTAVAALGVLSEFLLVVLIPAVTTTIIISYYYYYYYDYYYYYYYYCHHHYHYYYYSSSSPAITAVGRISHWHAILTQIVVTTELIPREFTGFIFNLILESSQIKFI